ncbi:FixH family protein [Gracilibacillus marinus]|jgi:hypothetical protein|uniref:FixH family protein n=1 Tax=Gracilibacillus marinus TaxID=630535 RepID=A0ABV8VTA5_9BACI
MKKLFIISLVLFFITACGNEQNNEHAEQEEIKGLKTEFELPESADVNQTIELKATVYYGEDLVTDADEVNFEYWNTEDSESTTTVESTNHNDGTYTTEVTFDEPGTYEIYAHTTAHELHAMPKKSITIEGEATKEHEHSVQHDEEEEHHHNENLIINMQPIETPQIEKNVSIAVTLTLNEEPLTEARVRYEIFNETEEVHEWIDAKEEENGMYTADHTFTQHGKYTIVTHVNNESGLHEHSETEIEVVE